MTPQDHSARCEAFRALHGRGKAFVIPNPWDAGSARILEHAGFEALATTSAGLAFSLGRRDGSVKRDEALANARDIIAATGLPVSADLENCYGDDPATVAETIGLAFAAGLSGASVEDASGRRDAPIYGRELAVERVAAAAREASRFPYPFTVTARAEGFLHGVRDLGEIIARLKAFEQAGAHVVYAPGLPDIEAIRAVTAAVSCPVNVLVGGRNPPSVPELAAAGVTRISLGALVSRAALGAVFRAAREILQEGTFGFTAEAATSTEVNACLGPRKAGRDHRPGRSHRPVRQDGDY